MRSQPPAGHDTEHVLSAFSQWSVQPPPGQSRVHAGALLQYTSHPPIGQARWHEALDPQCSSQPLVHANAQLAASAHEHVSSSAQADVTPPDEEVSVVDAGRWLGSQSSTQAGAAHPKAITSSVPGGFTRAEHTRGGDRREDARGRGFEARRRSPRGAAPRWRMAHWR